jgi:hypothetical protein
MFGDSQGNVGFLAENVGSMSDFLEEPDINLANGIKCLGRKCREWQVFLGGEDCHEFEEKANIDSCAVNPLIIRDLHNAGS